MARENKGLGYKVATTALWMVAIPALVIVGLVRGEKMPRIKKQ